jgi:hypothetical protein
MLVCRIYEDVSALLVTGSCNIRHYDTKGWFPIESFSFGFEHKDKDKGAGNNKQSGGSANRSAGGGTSTGSGAPRPATGQQQGSSDSSAEQSKVGISKPIDTATCDLMFLAMRDRNKKKGAESKIQADIHLLSVVDAVGPRWSYPSLMIHLEGVLIKNWRVNASGDERAGEELELQYDRAAMHYVSTKDAKEFRYYGPRGWNQTTDKEFTWEGQWKEYVGHLSNLSKVESRVKG